MKNLIHKNTSDYNSTKTRLFWVFWMLFFALGILVRLPHYLSRNFFFDGDEAVVGIMAQDLLEGKFSLYFYGQNYGFSFFEALSTSIFIKLLGSGIWALRLGGLLIFSLGTTFIFQTAQNRGTGLIWSLLIAAFVLCFPAWYLWGGMVRGGYVTAFTLCCAIFYIIHGTAFSFKKLAVTGILTALAFESHVLIVIPFTPFLLFWILKQKKPVLKLASLAGFFLISVLLIRWIGYTNAEWPNPELVLGWKRHGKNQQVQRQSHSDLRKATEKRSHCWNLATFPHDGFRGRILQHVLPG